MKIKVPHEVQIGPGLFKIYYKKIVKDDEGKVCSGLTVASARRIEISTSENETKTEILETIFHEFCHGMLYVSGQAAVIDSDAEEEGLVIQLENYVSPMLDWKCPVWKKWKLIEFTPKEKHNE